MSPFLCPSRKRRILDTRQRRKHLPAQSVLRQNSFGNCFCRTNGVFTRPSTSVFKIVSSVGVVFIVATMRWHL